MKKMSGEILTTHDAEICPVCKDTEIEQHGYILMCKDCGYKIDTE